MSKTYHVYDKNLSDWENLRAQLNIDITRINTEYELNLPLLPEKEHSYLTEDDESSSETITYAIVNDDPWRGFKVFDIDSPDEDGKDGFHLSEPEYLMAEWSSPADMYNRACYRNIVLPVEVRSVNYAAQQEELLASYKFNYHRLHIWDSGLFRELEPCVITDLDLEEDAPEEHKNIPKKWPGSKVWREKGDRILKVLAYNPDTMEPKLGGDAGDWKSDLDAVVAKLIGERKPNFVQASPTNAYNYTLSFEGGSASSVKEIFDSLNPTGFERVGIYANGLVVAGMMYFPVKFVEDDVGWLRYSIGTEDEENYYSNEYKFFKGDGPIFPEPPEEGKKFYIHSLVLPKAMTTLPENFLQHMTFTARNGDWNMYIDLGGLEVIPPNTFPGFMTRGGLVIHKHLREIGENNFAIGRYVSIKLIVNGEEEKERLPSLFSNNPELKEAIEAKIAGTGWDANIEVDETNRFF